MSDRSFLTTDQVHDLCSGAYAKGKEDAINELIANYNKDGIVYSTGYQQGRADAIDEFAELLLKHKSKDDYPVMCFDEFTIKRFAEQLKAQKNERRAK